MPEPIHIGQQHQLFLDNYLIEWLDKVSRGVCPVRKFDGNPVIRPESPREPNGYLTYGSVLYDPDDRLYKAWCNAVGEPRITQDPSSIIRGGCYYFTSSDGVHWNRPELDLFPLDGQPTNIVILGVHASHPRRWPPMYEVFGVTKDPGERDPARRYKMGYLHLVRDYKGPDADPNHPTEKRGLGVAFSEDGVHWSTGNSSVTSATVDGGTYWYRDERSRLFVLYGRGRHYPPEVLARYGEDRFFQQHNSGRAVNRAESSDFVHWKPDSGEVVMAADLLDGPGEEIYSLAVLPYEDFYVGLVQVFHNYPDRLYLDIQLATSRDGVHFERLSDRSPFIPVGVVGAWDRFNNSVANNPPHRVGDELRFYYSGRSYLHSGAYKGPDDGRNSHLPFIGAVGFGTIKVDRFAALEASFDAGRVRTRLLRFDGQRLHLNADARFGRVEVALLSADGEAIQGQSAHVQDMDGLDVAVPMAGLGKLAGKPVRFEFTLHNARLYAFWID